MRHEGAAMKDIIARRKRDKIIDPTKFVKFVGCDIFYYLLSQHIAYNRLWC